MTAITAGTSYTFTPNVPAAPTGMNFTGVGPRTITVNWTDNATTEIAYQITRSTDGINFTPLASLPANSSTYTDNFLLNTTNYTYKVVAISEGALSSPLVGSQMTTTPTAVNATASGGNWSDPATWVGGVVPNANNNVTIPAGSTVTIDTAAATHNLTVDGTLQFESATTRTLNITNGLTVAGILQSSSAGSVVDHTVMLANNATVSGTLDLSTNGNTAGANLVLVGDSSAGIGGTGTLDVRTITVNAATASSHRSIGPAIFTVRGSSVDHPDAGFLTITQGTFIIGGTFTANLRTFATPTFTIPATGGFRLDNPNYTITAQTGSATMNGELRVLQGTFNIGTAINDSIAFGPNSFVRIEGGAINVAGRFGVGAAANAIDYRHLNGTVTVATVGNTSTTLASFDMGTSTSSFVSMGAGSIIIQNASTAATTPRDYRLQSGSATTSNGTSSVTGAVVQFGNAATTGVQVFNGAGVFPTLTIDATAGGHTFNMLAPVTWNNVTRNVTINPGTTFNIGNFVYLFNGVNFVNNGTFTGTGAASNFVPFDATGNVVVSGTGTFTGVTTAIGMQAANLTLNQSSQWRVRNLRVFTGNIINASKITLGNNDATVSVVQFGNTTTPTQAGTLDSAPTFELGAGGQTVTYLRSGPSRTTGPEINPGRTLVGLTYDNNEVGRTLTLAGGDLTVTGAMALTNGIVVTGANTITHNGTATRTAGYVEGNLRRSYTAAGTYTFHVGVNGYSPVLANVTTLTTNPSTLTVTPVDSVLTGLAPAVAVSRFWTLTENGDLTANLTFTYQTADVSGIETAYKVFKRTGGVTTEVAPSVINAANNTAAVTGITDFSDWGIGQALTPTVPNANISGQVVTGFGAAPGVRVDLSNEAGLVASSLTNSFGAYHFGPVPTGTNYTVTVSSRRYTFATSSLTFYVGDNVSAINFTGAEVSSLK